MKLIVVFSSFVLALLGTIAVAAPQADRTVRHGAKISVIKAEEVAIKEFKKRSKDSVAKASVRLLEDNDKDWVFVVENEDQAPAPGTELYVTVNKKTAKAESYFGK